MYLGIWITIRRDDAKKAPFQAAPEQTPWTWRGFWFVHAGSGILVLAPACLGLLMRNHFARMAWSTHCHLWDVLSRSPQAVGAPQDRRPKSCSPC